MNLRAGPTWQGNCIHGFSGPKSTQTGFHWMDCTSWTVQPCAPWRDFVTPERTGPPVPL